MTDKIINIFNKQPIETDLNSEEVQSTIDNLVEIRDSVKELIVIAVTGDEEMLITSSNMTKETAYYLLGIAQLNALTQ